jgi:hypothetical protein
MCTEKSRIIRRSGRIPNGRHDHPKRKYNVTQIKLTGMKYHRSALITGFIIFFVCIVGCTTTSPSSQSSTGFLITDTNGTMELVFGQPLFIIQGMVKNQLGHELDNVRVTCTLFDTNGVELGYNDYNVGALADGASAKFKVELPKYMIAGYPKNLTWKCEAK